MADVSYFAKNVLPTRSTLRACRNFNTNTSSPLIVAVPSTNTLPGVADIDGPRTVRPKPETWEYASLKMSSALASGTSKYRFGPVSRSTNM